MPLEKYQAYKYLTIEQSLEDVVYFANHFQPQGLEQHWPQLKPNKSPWIFVGGSYPGARAAWIRDSHPDTIYASWASSAAVHRMVNGHAYMNAIYSLMPTNCTNDMVHLTKHFDQLFLNASSQEVLSFKEMAAITLQEASIRHNGTIRPLNLTSQRLELYANEYDQYTLSLAIMQAFIGSFQYTGYRDVGVFCDALQSFNPAELNSSSPSIEERIISALTNPANGTPPAQGIVSEYGVDMGIYALFHAVYKSAVNVQRETNDTATNGPDPYAPSDRASWDWVVCNEFGGFRVADPQNR